MEGSEVNKGLDPPVLDTYDKIVVQRWTENCENLSLDPRHGGPLL